MLHIDQSLNELILLNLVLMREIGTGNFQIYEAFSNLKIGLLGHIEFM